MTAPVATFLEEDISVGELARWLNHQHLLAARRDPPDTEAMKRIQNMSDVLEATVTLYRANDHP